IKVILWRAGWGWGLAYLGGVAGLMGGDTASEGTLAVRRTLAVVLAIPQAPGQAGTGGCVWRQLRPIGRSGIRRGSWYPGARVPGVRPGGSGGSRRARTGVSRP